MPRIGRSNRYDGGASHTLLSIYAALPAKFEARHANSYKCRHERHRGSSQSDLEGVCRVERGTGRARSQTGCHDGAAFNRSAAGAQAARKPLAIKITLTPQSS